MKQPVRSLLAGGNVTVMRATAPKPSVAAMSNPLAADGIVAALDRIAQALKPVVPTASMTVEKPDVDDAALAARDAELTQLRTLLGEAEDRATTGILAIAANEQLHETISQMEAAHAKALRENVKTVTVPGPPIPPPRSEDIKIVPTFGMTGLLQRVVLSAKGYDTVTLDVERGIDGTIKQLKERTP